VADGSYDDAIGTFFEALGQLELEVQGEIDGVIPTGSAVDEFHREVADYLTKGTG
jgi:hypothetical protein